jgi:hypothetical protein
MDSLQESPGSPSIRVAIETLARELGCEVEQIVVVESTPVTWRTSALGCPRPGRMYLQVLTPGYRVRLAHAGREYTLHTDRGRRAIRCEKPMTGPFASTEA